MKISPDNVSKVAALARLSLSQDELESYSIQLDAVLRYMAQLDELDIDQIEVTTHAVPLNCPMRVDLIEQFDTALIMNQAPERAEQHFKVPKIIE